jgi:hypothetical protein
MLGILGGFRGLLSGLCAAAITWALLSTWDRLIDDPAVASAARLAFVEKAEKAEAVAMAAEARRQRDAVQKATEEFNHKLLVQEALNARKIEEREQRISDYEKRMEGEGRSDRLTGADIDLLRQP